MEGGHAMWTARMKFSKGEQVKYISHLDLQRAFQRALRRADIDMAYSQGFNPHPKISFAMALAVGMTSLEEYVDIELNQWVLPEELIKRLNKSLPTGLEILQCKITKDSLPSLMSTIEKSIYEIKIYNNKPISKREIEDKINALLGREEIMIERVNKRGKKSQKNIRPLIDYIKVDTIEEKEISFKMMLSTGSQNNLKPEIVIDNLLDISDETIKIHRISLLAGRDQELISPLEFI